MCEIEDCKPIGLGIRKTIGLGCGYAGPVGRGGVYVYEKTLGRMRDATSL